MKYFIAPMLLIAALTACKKQELEPMPQETKGSAFTPLKIEPTKNEK